jgi:uncharacterized protein YndB with AHSA1/START domain
MNLQTSAAAVQTVSTENRELVITRIFNAPRELVFEMWTNPEHLTRWWGPTDFTLPSCEIDFKVGGKYRYCMHAPDGEDHWVWGVYQEITPPEKLIFTWDREDPDGTPRSKSTVTLTFEDAEGKTKFTLRQGTFEHQWDCDEHSEGWTQTLDRLAALVETANDEN